MCVYISMSSYYQIYAFSFLGIPSICQSHLQIPPLSHIKGHAFFDSQILRTLHSQWSRTNLMYYHEVKEFQELIKAYLFGPLIMSQKGMRLLILDVPKWKTCLLVEDGGTWAGGSKFSTTQIPNL